MRLRTLIVLHLVSARRAIHRATEIARLAGVDPLDGDREACFRVTLPKIDAQALAEALERNPGPLRNATDVLIVALHRVGVFRADVARVVVTLVVGGAHP